MAREPIDREWMIPIWNYLSREILPQEANEARKIKLKACHFVIDDDELFRRGFLFPTRKCVTKRKAEYVMDEIHRDICGMHNGRGQWFLKWLGQVFIGPLYMSIAENGSKGVINAKGLQM